MGLDTRGLHFAREVRRQLAGSMAQAGPKLLPEASAATARGHRGGGGRRGRRTCGIGGGCGGAWREAEKVPLPCQAPGS